MPEITKTQPLDSTAIRRLSRVAAVIFIDYLGSSPDWDLKMHSGSWTLQNIHIPEQVVKLTVDRNQKICSKTTAIIHKDHPVLIGISVEGMSPIPGIKSLFRAGLKKLFGSGYVDPRDTGNDTWHLQPIFSHEYDLIFLDSGFCEFTEEHMRQANEYEQVWQNSTWEQSDVQ
jgi:hypothetical protein